MIRHRNGPLTTCCLAALVALTCVGCVGLDSLIFATKTEVAVDFDTRPPTLNVGFKRMEVVLAPEFQGGEKILPVLTTIGASASPLNLFSDQSYATGDAAIVMAEAFTSDEEYFPLRKLVQLDGSHNVGTIRTSPMGDRGGLWGAIKYFFVGNDQRKRYFFGTDSLLGLHVEWAGGQMPSAVALGWKRKELAYIPLMEEPIENTTTNGGTRTPENVKIRLPSLLATASADVNAGRQEDTGARIGQTYATGIAATLLSGHGGVRRVLGSALVTGAEDIRKQNAEAYRDTFQVQRAIIADIQQKMNDAATSAAQKAAALAKAKELDLVDDATTENNLVANLGLKANGKPVNTPLLGQVQNTLK